MPKKKKIFISFPIEDERLCDLLAGQEDNENSPFEFFNMSVKESFDEAWKINCREKIKKCEGLISIITNNTTKTDRQLWEINCAKEESIPIHAMWGYKDTKKRLKKIPKELIGITIHDWEWESIRKFMKKI